MPAPRPLYTLQNCKAAYQLNWSITVFWNEAITHESWLDPLTEQTESDSVRILQHHFRSAVVSQFLVSSKPEIAPAQLLRSIKGRLQYILRADRPGAFKRNYALRSIGAAKQEVVDRYIASQIKHHPMADPAAACLFQQFQQHDPDVDLSAVRSTAHGRFWYNLHLVICNNGRWRDLDRNTLGVISRIVRAVSEKYGFLLKRCALLPDHTHIEVGCTFDVSPADTALRFMNNIVYAFQMRPLLEFSYYVGTIGEYDRGVCSAGM